MSDKAKVLDRFSIPSRDASAHPSGPPYPYDTRADADVLIIPRDSAQPFHERIPNFLRSGVRISLDVFAYTLSEAVQALREGIWLVDKEGVKEQVQAMPPVTEIG